LRVLSICISAAMLWTPAYAAPPLLADVVSVVDTSNVDTSFGRLLLSEQVVPGPAALTDEAGVGPRLSILGCTFGIALEPDNLTLQKAAPVLSRKLTTGGDPPSAGFGRLTNPTPNGVTDPITQISCDRKLEYFIFLYRQRPASGVLVVEALVLEYDDVGRQLFEAQRYDEQVEKPSLQAMSVLTAARSCVRVSLRTTEDAARAATEDKASAGLLLGMLRLFFTGGM
jgi:hypothetical protein